MPNNLLTISMITREAIPLFVNSNAFIKNVSRQFDSEYGRSGEKIGSQLRIRLPNDYVVTDGPALSVQDTAEQQTVLTMSLQKHVDVSFTSADMLLSLDDFSERILLPMMNNLAGKVSSNIMQANAEALCNISGNMNAENNIQSPTDGTYLDAKATLDINSAPPVRHKIINDPRTEARVVTSLSGLLNPNTAISDQYYEGVMYRALNALWFSDALTIKHTSGSFTAGTVNGAGQTGPSIIVNPITGTLLAGDFITITSMIAVNRVAKTTTGELRQLVILTNAANGATTLNVYPSIIPSAGGNDVQYQTVVNSPANGAAISLYTNPGVTYRKNFRYVPEAITLATGDLPMPENKITARHRYDNISMRYVADYIIGTDQRASRLDILFGSLTTRPEWGCIVPDKV